LCYTPGRMAPVRLAAYITFALLGVGAVAYGLGPVLLAGLFSYTILDIANRKLTPRVGAFWARWTAVLVFLLTATCGFWLFGKVIRESLQAIPAILAKVVPMVTETTAAYRIELPFENIEELRRVALDTLKSNAADISHASGILTKGFFHILAGIFVAILAFLAEAMPGEADGRSRREGNLHDAFRKEFDRRIARFMLSFERVLGAQVLISAINTVATTAFLLAMGYPFAAFLIPATFILGIMPIVGNIASNMIIVGTGLTLSGKHAIGALIFLIGIHKAEYFLNSRIVGSSIRTPMWQTLLAILLGEVVMGIPGIVLAPALLHYAREELRDIPYEG